MKRLYYIITLIKKDHHATWSKAELGFVAIQWMLLFCFPILILDQLSKSGRIDWYNYEQVKPFILFASVLLICLNHFFLFRKKQANKIIDKYTGRYPLIDKYPVRAYFLFHLILPIVLLICIFLIVGVLKK